MASTLRDRYEAEMERFQFQNALERGVQDHPAGQQVYRRERPVGAGQGSAANRVRLATVMYQSAGDHPHLRRAADALYAGERREDLRSDRRLRGLPDMGEAPTYGGPCAADATVHKGEALFPRIDAEKALAELEELEAQQRKAALPALEVEPYTEEKVDFDTFCKSDLRAVKVKDCEPVKKSDKLLKFTLDDGTGTDRVRSSPASATYYEPEQLIGKTADGHCESAAPEDDGYPAAAAC